MSTLAAPQNLEAERDLLGTLLTFYKPSLIHVAQTAGLTPQDFYWQRHEVVYRAVVNLHAAGSHVDTLTVSRFLQGKPHMLAGSWLERIGGRAQVEFLACFHEVNGFRERALIVHEDGRWRRWLRALYDALECIDRRDEDAFWAAVGRVREDILGQALRVIEGREEAA